MVGAQTYLEGHLPGAARFVVQLFEPTTVRLHILLENVKAVGTETTFTWHEERCRSRIREEMTGRSFVGEAEKAGVVAKSADLAGIGDHLIEFNSDAQADFLLKVETIPKKDQ